jgi:hypothetical protein
MKDNSRCHWVDNFSKIGSCLCHPIAIWRLEQSGKIVLHLVPRFVEIDL